MGSFPSLHGKYREDVGGRGRGGRRALLFRFRESGWLRVRCYDCMKLEAKQEQNNLKC